MKNIWILSGITIKEGMRNRILFGILFFVVVMCGVNLVVTTSFTRDLGKVAVDVGLSTISISGLAIIFFMGMPLLAKDLDKLTIYMILARPIPRSHYIIGKYIGLGALLFISVIILSIITAFSIKIIMGINPNYIPALFSWKIFGIAVFFSMMSLMTITALSILFTCVSTSPFMAYVLTAGSYFIGQNIESVRQLVAHSKTGGPLIHKLFLVVSWVFPNLSALDMKTSAAYGLELTLKDSVITFIYSLTYILIVLLMTILVFNKRELT